MPHLSIFSARLTQHNDQSRTLPDKRTAVYQRSMRILYRSTAIPCRMYVPQRRRPIGNLLIQSFDTAFFPMHLQPTTFSPLPRAQLPPPRPNPYLDRLNPKSRPIYALDISWSFFADHGRGRPVRLHGSSPLQISTLSGCQLLRPQSLTLYKSNPKSLDRLIQKPLRFRAGPRWNMFLRETSDRIDSGNS